MAWTKLLPNESVPEKDTTDNNTYLDVIGNKLDSSIGGPGVASLYGIAGFMSYYHVHSPAVVVPDLQDPIQISSSGSVWGYGQLVEIIPAGGIQQAFDIHWVHTSDISSQGFYQLQLSSGSVGYEVTIGTIAFSRDSNQVQTASQPIQIPPQPPNERISARLASNIQVASVGVKLYLHEYPS